MTPHLKIQTSSPYTCQVARALIRSTISGNLLQQTAVGQNHNWISNGFCIE